jgi:peptide/nickel transport system permease protein
MAIMPRLLRLRRNPLALSAVVVLLLLVIVAVVAPIIWTDSAEATNVLAASKPSSAQHWFGTDKLGRDLFYRTFVATRLTLLLALSAAAIGMLIGIPLGLLPAVLGSRSRRAVAGVIGAGVALPGLLLALFINTVIGVGALGAVLGIGIANAPILARLAQTLSAGVATKDYVSAARMLGASRTSLLFRHILPNVAEPLILTGTMSVGWCLLEIATLSFLGLGVRPPAYDWGSLLSEGLQGIYNNPMGALGPALFVVISGLAFALLGESLAGASRRVPSLRHLPRAVTGRSQGSEDKSAGNGAVADAVLSAGGLTVRFPTPSGEILTAVDDLDLTIAPGESVGIVGESGSGKSVTSLALAQLVAYPGRVDWTSLTIAGADIRSLSTAAQRKALGDSLAMVSQDPMTALNPVLRVGRQLAEVAEVHAGKGRRAARSMAVEQLDRVQIAEPAQRARQFPFEFSGGMRQRAVIGMGLMAQPKLIIADEPTTALDVTVQRQILDLLEELNTSNGTAILLISHDIAVIANVCTRVLVMYAGRIVEDIGVDSLLDDSAHPYTRALIAAVPTMASDRATDLAVIPGRPPDLADVPTGCAFAPRCSFATDQCRETVPPLIELGDGRRAACWHPQHGRVTAVKAAGGVRG